VGLFLNILNEITLPIVVVASAGFFLQRRLQFDVATLNRFLVYAILPCFLVHYLSTASIPLAEVGVTAWFTVAQFVVLVGIGWGAATVLKMPGSTRPVLALAAAFPNSGNYGIPLVQLAFGPEYILHQAVIVSLHSILITSLGVLLISRHEVGWTTSLRAAFSTPLIPAVAFGMLLKLFDVHLPPPIAVPMQVLGSAYTPVALFALGAQLAISKWSNSPAPLGLALGLRFILAPAATWVAVILLDVPRGLADMLIVTAAAPVGVLLAIVCSEYRVGEGLASAVVFASTALSPLFVTGVLYATRGW
jgi:malate permease and related proteins